MVEYTLGVAIKPKKSIAQYRKEKIRIMTKDFCIRLTETEINRINNLPTINAINAYCIKILNERWN